MIRITHVSFMLLPLIAPCTCELEVFPSLEKKEMTDHFPQAQTVSYSSFTFIIFKHIFTHILCVWKQHETQTWQTKYTTRENVKGWWQYKYPHYSHKYSHYLRIKSNSQAITSLVQCSIIDYHTKLHVSLFIEWQVKYTNELQGLFFYAVVHGSHHKHFHNMLVIAHGKWLLRS